jgi:RNA-directed DNA polymerase
VVPTPLLSGKQQTAIEDFFDSMTLAMPLNGKTFSPEKKIDESSQIGKTPFALNIVAKNAGTIDFNGFKSILDRVVKVIDDYEVKLTVAAK